MKITIKTFKQLLLCPFSYHFIPPKPVYKPQHKPNAQIHIKPSTQPDAQKPKIVNSTPSKPDAHKPKIANNTPRPQSQPDAQRSSIEQKSNKKPDAHKPATVKQCISGIKKHKLIFDCLEYGMTETDDSLVNIALRETEALIPNGAVILHTEQTVGFLGIRLIPDLWFVKNRHLFIVDYKFGKFSVKVYPNFQLLMYACAITEKVQCDRITCGIIQPTQKTCLNTHTNTIANLVSWKLRAEEHYNRVLNGFDTPNPSNSNCKPCQHCRICPHSVFTKQEK